MSLPQSLGSWPEDDSRGKGDCNVEDVCAAFVACAIHHRCEREGDMAVCHVLPGGASDLHGMVGKIFNQLLKESIDQSWYSKVADFFGDKVRNVGFFGVSVRLGKNWKA